MIGNWWCYTNANQCIGLSWIHFDWLVFAICKNERHFPNMKNCHFIKDPCWLATRVSKIYPEANSGKFRVLLIAKHYQLVSATFSSKADMIKSFPALHLWINLNSYKSIEYCLKISTISQVRILHRCSKNVICIHTCLKIKFVFLYGK